MTANFTLAYSVANDTTLNTFLNASSTDYLQGVQDYVTASTGVYTGAAGIGVWIYLIMFGVILTSLAMRSWSPSVIFMASLVGAAVGAVLFPMEAWLILIGAAVISAAVILTRMYYYVGG